MAVLLIVGGAAAAGLLALRIDERVQVIVARNHIATGQQIRAADLGTAPVASEGVNVIPAKDASRVVGQFAAQDIPAGRLVDAQMVSPSGLLKQGRAAVGVVLKPGRAPASGVQAGDGVLVVRAVDGAPDVLSSNAIVGSVRSGDSGSFGSGSGEPVATILVDTADAPKVAAAAAADQVVIIVISRGGGG